MGPCAWLVALSCGLMGASTLRQEPARPALETRLEAADLDFLVGEWLGTLEYLDYQDNATRRKLAVTLNARRVAGTIEYQFLYTEPNGKLVEGDATRLTLTGNGVGLRLNDEPWTVAGKEIDPARKLYDVTLARDGMDGGKPARLRRTLNLKSETLTIRTEVQAENQEKPLLRNEYTLKKR